MPIMGHENAKHPTIPRGNKNDNNRIIKNLTETNMKLAQERDCYKRLYKLNKITTEMTPR